MGRRHVEPELFHESRQSGCLTHGKVKNETRQRRRVDDRVLQRTFETPADKPGVECVMTVLYQYGAVGEAQECAPGVAEVGRADEHRPVDVVPPLGVRVDRRPAVNQRVEEREGPVKAKAFGSELQDQEG